MHQQTNKIMLTTIDEPVKKITQQAEARPASEAFSMKVGGQKKEASSMKGFLAVMVILIAAIICSLSTEQFFLKELIVSGFIILMAMAFRVYSR